MLSKEAGVVLKTLEMISLTMYAINAVAVDNIVNSMISIYHTRPCAYQ